MSTSFIANSGLVVSPNDSTDLARVARQIYVGTGGHIKVTLARDTSPVVLKNVPAGTLLEIAIKRIWSTGTTAADLIALY